MLTLLLLRHAKSSWAERGITDFDRPLNERGLAAAPLIGRYLTASGLTPQVAVSSPALRARTTANLVLAECPGAPALELHDGLYDGGPEAMFNIAAQIQTATSPILMVGHNPTIHALALALAPDGNAEAFRKLAIKYPTGGLAVIDFDMAEWRGIEAGAGRLRDFISPRELDHGE